MITMTNKMYQQNLEAYKLGYNEMKKAFDSLKPIYPYKNVFRLMKLFGYVYAATVIHINLSDIIEVIQDDDDFDLNMVKVIYNVVYIDAVMYLESISSGDIKKDTITALNRSQEESDKISMKLGNMIKEVVETYIDNKVEYVTAINECAAFVDNYNKSLTKGMLTAQGHTGLAKLV